MEFIPPLLGLRSIYVAALHDVFAMSHPFVSYTAIILLNTMFALHYCDEQWQKDVEGIEVKSQHLGRRRFDDRARSRSFLLISRL